MKKLAINDTIRKYLAKFAEGVDENAISVYEAIAINTLPVKKAGLFSGAIMAESLLKEMVQFVQNGGSVPIHQIHDQSYALPVGKQIHAELNDGEKGLEVRVLFYVDNAHDKIVSGLETSAIDEVSIGTQAKKMLCSECGWDYAGPEATMENFWNLTCANEHEIGVDGVHLNLSGLAGWYETSVVSRGAAQGAKILGKSKSILGEVEYNRLAASGISPSLKLLQASATPAPPPENQMDLKELLAQLTALTTAKALVDAELVTAKASATDLTTKLAAITSEKAASDLALTTAQAEVARLTALPATTDAIKLKADADKAREIVLSQANSMAVAAGGAKLADTVDLTAIEASIKDSSLKLAALPVGGVSHAAPAGTGNSKQAVFAASSFNSQ